MIHRKRYKINKQNWKKMQMNRILVQINIVLNNTDHTWFRNSRHDREPLDHNPHHHYHPHNQHYPKEECRFHIVAQVILSHEHFRPHLRPLPRGQPFNCLLPFQSRWISLSQNSLVAPLLERTLYHCCNLHCLGEAVCRGAILYTQHPNPEDGGRFGTAMKDNILMWLVEPQCRHHRLVTLNPVEFRLDQH